VKWEILNVEKSDVIKIWDIVCENKWTGYSIEDLYYILRISPQCCYKLMVDGTIAGGIFGTLESGKLCISFFCIQSDKRVLSSSLGLGESILKYAKRHAPYTMTYANQKMIRIYKRFGFIEECYIENFVVQRLYENYEEEPHIKEVTREILEQDKEFSNYVLNKSCFLEYFSYANARCYIYKSNYGLGYVFSRNHTGQIIGPLVADNHKIAKSLLIHCMRNIRECTVFGTKDVIKELFDPSIFSVKETKVKVLKMTLGKSTFQDERMKLVGGHHFIS